jgi:hypothetical protein
MGVSNHSYLPIGTKNLSPFFEVYERKYFEKKKKIA